jgi:hypothetical protein
VSAPREHWLELLYEIALVRAVKLIAGTADAAGPLTSTPVAIGHDYQGDEELQAGPRRPRFTISHHLRGEVLHIYRASSTAPSSLKGPWLKAGNRFGER